MMTTLLSVVKRVILVATTLRYNAAAVMILVISPKNAPRKLPNQGHHNRSCFHLHHSHNCRDRSHSFHHRCSQKNYLDRSGSHHQSQNDRSSCHHWKHISHSISHYDSHSHYPSTDRYPRRHSHRIPYTATGHNASRHSSH